MFKTAPMSQSDRCPLDHNFLARFATRSEKMEQPSHPNIVVYREYRLYVLRKTNIIGSHQMQRPASKDFYLLILMEIAVDING